MMLLRDIFLLERIERYYRNFGFDKESYYNKKGKILSQLLKDKVVIVTGAGSGIGRASAILFAKEGAKVVVANRTIEKGNETVKMIGDIGGDSISVQCDVSQEESIINLINESVKKFGKINCAFNCAGTDGAKKTIVDLEGYEFEEVIQTNLMGTFYLVKYQIKQMLKQKDKGTIVNMASINGLLGRPKRTPYNSSRSGIIALTKTTAIEYIKEGIRVNCVAPGAVNTDLFRKFTNADNKIMKQYAEAHPIGRIAEPEEIAEAALWLLSDKSSFIVGHTLVIDGGLTIL